MCQQCCCTCCCFVCIGRLQVYTHAAMQLTASPSQNLDLLPAMRGAGTVFGVVTEVAFKAYDVADYHGECYLMTSTALASGRTFITKMCALLQYTGRGIRSPFRFLGPNLAVNFIEMMSVRFVLQLHTLS